MLSSIGHDGSILEAMIIQCLPYRLDLSVYHRGGTYHIDPFLRVAHGDARQPLQGPIVVNLSVFYHPAVAVAGILTHADICHDDNCSAPFVFQSLNRLLNDSVCSVCRRTSLVLCSRNSKQDHCFDASVSEGGCLSNHRPGRQSSLSRHSRDRNVRR